MASVDHVRQIALISSNQDEAIAEIMCRIFSHETINFDSVSVGGSDDTYHTLPTLEFIEGYSFDAGYLSPYFANGSSDQTLVYGTSANYDTGVGAGAYLFVTD